MFSYHFRLLETINKTTGNSRYYVFDNTTLNGQAVRVSKERFTFLEIMALRKDTFLTISTKTHRQHHKSIYY